MREPEEKCPGGCEDILAMVQAHAEVVKRLDSGESVFTEMRKFRSDFEVFKKEWNTIRPQLQETAEIVQAWKNVKGFHNTLNIISGMAKGMAAIGAFFAGVYLFMKHGVK